MAPRDVGGPPATNGPVLAGAYPQSRDSPSDSSVAGDAIGAPPAQPTWVLGPFVTVPLSGGYPFATFVSGSVT